MKGLTGFAIVALLVTSGATASVAQTREFTIEPQVTESVLLKTLSTDQAAPVIVKSLTDYPGRVREVTQTQKAEIREVLSKLDGNTKFICTGARLAGQSEGMNLAVRMRAKLVCEYAKSLRPELSYWYQTKLTEKRNFNGRVIVVSK